MSNKEALYEHCLRYVQERRDNIQQEIKRAQELVNEETKSSAGDKYETSRAMAQLEIERNSWQLGEVDKLRQVVHSIDITKKSDVVKVGSLVSTSNGEFFIAISLGQATLQQRQFVIVSADAPLGKLLIGKKVNESITWNRKEFVIQVIE